MDFAKTAVLYTHPETEQRFVVGRANYYGKDTGYRRSRFAIIFDDKIPVDHLNRVGTYSYFDAMKLLTISEEEFKRRTTKVANAKSGTAVSL